jgi:hypothetical protein
LPENFPGISFNPNGICNICVEFKGTGHLNQKKNEYRRKFNGLVKEHKGKNIYDALMCYSGGKDSTYTLSVLKEKYGLKILAITFDNGFIPEKTFENIRSVTERLGIDHILFKPNFDTLKLIFRACAKNSIFPRKTLERASTICTSCMGIVKFTALRFALEKKIPFIVFGWSPGQAPIESSIFKNNPAMIKIMQDVVLQPLHKLAGNDINPYFLDDSYFNGSYSFPYNISPLAFLEYNEDMILKKIAYFGWESPKETDSSTNCLLNSYAILVHKKQFNFHPYVYELAKLVREGYLSRICALKKINKLISRKNISVVKKKLNIDRS